MASWAIFFILSLLTWQNVADTEGHVYRISWFCNLWRRSTSDLFSINQGSGQGRIVVPFLYKVFIYRLLFIISNDPFPLSIENVPVGCPTFADDLTLLALFQAFCITSLVLFSISRLKRCYDFNHTKNGVRRIWRI